MPPQDLENTVGSWDMYGVEESKRYPGLQAEFFERAAAPLTRRESIVSFIATGQISLATRLCLQSRPLAGKFSSCHCFKHGLGGEHLLVQLARLPSSSGGPRALRMRSCPSQSAHR